MLKPVFPLFPSTPQKLVTLINVTSPIFISKKETRQNVLPGIFFKGLFSKRKKP